MEQKYIIIGVVIIFLIIAIVTTIIILKKKKNVSSNNSDNGGGGNNSGGGGGNNSGGGGGNNQNTECSPLNFSGTCANGQSCYKGNCNAIIPSGKFVIYQLLGDNLYTLSFIAYNNVTGDNLYKNYYFPLGLVSSKTSIPATGGFTIIPGTFMVSADNNGGSFNSLDVYYEYESDTKYIRVYSGTFLNTHSSNTKWYLKSDLNGNNNQGVVSVVSSDKSPTPYNIIAVGSNIVIQDANSLKYLTKLNQLNNTVNMIGLNSDVNSAVIFTKNDVQDILSTTGNNGTQSCDDYCGDNTNNEITNMGWKTATCGGGIDNLTPHDLYSCNVVKGGSNNYINCSCLKTS